MKKNRKKITTIDGLARLMQAEFVVVHEKFRGVDGKFVKIRGEIGELRVELMEVKQDVKWMKDNSSELFTKFGKFISLYEA